MVGSLLKMAIGGGQVGPKELATLLEGIGFKVNFQELQRDYFAPAFQRAAREASLPASRVMVISGTDREGAKIEALLVLAPASVTVEKSA